MRAGRLIRWGSVALITLAFIVVPFALFEDRLHGWTLEAIRADAPASWVAGAVVLLLGADILLPVPSSLVSTAAGTALGFFFGLLASVLGMTLCCQVGYWVGRTSSSRLLKPLVTEEDLKVVSGRFEGHLGWALGAARGVPVLAEASVLLAGAMRVDPARFSSITVLANIGISAVYCALGSAVIDAASFLLALAAAILLPAVALRLVLAEDKEGVVASLRAALPKGGSTQSRDAPQHAAR